MSGFNEISEFLLHEVIHEFLGQHKISLRELSVQSEIPYSTIYSWSLGGKPKDLTKLKKLADTMELSLDQLIFKELSKEISPLRTIQVKVEVTIKKE